MGKRTPQTVVEMAEYLLALVAGRRKIMAARKKELGSTRRLSLTKKERKYILAKTEKRCHLCGGKAIRGKQLVADHVFAHAVGGKHALGNYLAAHGNCNRYRWHWSPQEFQLILKLGVWARKQMEKQTPTGKKIFEGFSRREKTRASRGQKKSNRMTEDDWS